MTTIGTARVATSAVEARTLWLLTDSDQVTANPDRQWTDAARTARTLADGGYRPPARLPIPVIGRRGIAAAEALTYNQLAGRQISEHDRKVILELARVMSGGGRRGNRGRRAAPPGARARGLPAAAGGAADPRSHPPHAQDRQAAAELGDWLDA
jgi:hypothetical protein